MAEQDDTLTPEQIKKAERWISEKCGELKTCNSCGASNWVVARDMISTTILNNQAIQIGGRFYPQIMLICVECGHSLFFNAKLMGVFTDAEDGVSENSESEDA